MTGGGGVVAGGFFFALVFLCGFFPFSTFPALERAFPGERPLSAVVLLVVVVGVGVDVVPAVVVLFVEAVGFGFDGAGLVEVEVGVEVEVEVVGAWVVVVTVRAGVVAATGGQVWETLTIGSWTGRGSEFGFVPGATPWNVNCWPPATVITTVQPSADALGIAPKPNTATRQNKVTAAIDRLRLLNTVAYSSRGVPLVNSSQLRSQIGFEGRYLLPPSFAIRNRRCLGCLFGYQRVVTLVTTVQATMSIGTIPWAL